MKTRKLLVILSVILYCLASPQKLQAKEYQILDFGAKADNATINTKAINSAIAKCNEEGWSWKPLQTGGVLTVRHMNGNEVAVFGK
ncbi:MAG: hypothetical protein WCI54_17390 [Bacteroidia bacterium]